MKSRDRRRLWLLPLALLGALGLCEVVLRSKGFRPWNPIVLRPGEPILHEPDPVLGWRNKEGSYRVPSYWPGDPDIHVTFESNGRRATSTTHVQRARRVVILGCSWTQGWAVSDEETWAWKLQERFPDVEVCNYGTGAYGTLQCLLRLERHYAEVGGADVVVYAFVNVHAERNMGEIAWLSTLSRGEVRNHVEAPWVDLGPDGGLRRHSPVSYPSFPLRKKSALVSLLQRLVAEARFSRKPGQRHEATWRLVLEMQATARAHGSRFLVAVLGSQPYVAPYLDRLAREEIPFVDCVQPFSQALIVRGDGHPNGKLHTIWADCIEPVLRDVLDRR